MMERRRKIVERRKRGEQETYKIMQRQKEIVISSKVDTGEQKTYLIKW